MAERPPRLGQRRALLISTSRYSEPTLRNLPAAHNDHEAMAAVLGPGGPGGFDLVRLPENPNKQSVLREVERLFGPNAHPDDVVLLYLTGHGQLDDDNSLWFALRESRKEQLRATYLDARWIRGVLESSKVNRQLVIVDTCHSRHLLSAKSGQTAVEVHKLRQAQIHGLVPPDTSKRANGHCRCFFFACGPDRQAYTDHPEQGMSQLSLLTSAIVASLTDGTADLDGDGIVGVDELWQAVELRGEGWQNQRPERAVGGAGRTRDLVVARVPPQPQGHIPKPTTDIETIRSLRPARRRYRRRTRWRRSRNAMIAVVLVAASLGAGLVRERLPARITTIDLPASKWTRINTDGTAVLATLRDGTLQVQVPPGRLTWYGYHYPAPKLCDYTLELQTRHGPAPTDPRAVGWGYGISIASVWNPDDQSGAGWTIQDEFSRTSGQVYGDIRITSLANPNLAPYPPFALLPDQKWHTWKLTIKDGQVTVTRDNTSIGKYPLDRKCGGIFLRGWSEITNFRHIKLTYRS